MRRLLLILGLGFTSLFARAEGLNAGGTGLGFIGGFSFGHNRSMNAGLLESKMGMGYGLVTNFVIAPKAALEIDLMLVDKSYESLLANGSREAYYLTFFQIPVLLRWMVTNNFHIKVGPYLGAFLTSATKETNGGTSPVKSEFKNDFGATLGAWFGFQAKRNMMVGFEMRYDLGIADIQNDGDPSTAIYTRAAMGLFSIVFQFK